MNHYEATDVLVNLFNEILDLEERALITPEYKNISVNDMHIMDAVGIREQKNMSTVARALNVTVGTLTIAVNNLVKKGYIQRVRSEEDRRVVLISLTEKGEKAFCHHRDFHEKMVLAILKDLNVEETEALTRALTKLQKFFLQLSGIGKEQIFFHHRELYRADFHDPAVKLFQIKIMAQLFPAACLQILEIQAAPVIFQIIAGSFYNVLVDFFYCRFLGDAEGFEKSCGSALIPALVVDADVQQGIETQVGAAGEPCQLCGILDKLRSGAELSVSSEVAAAEFFIIS